MSSCIRDITPDSGHYFHGFYNIQPWSPDGRQVLCHRVAQIDRMPEGDDEIEIGLLDVAQRAFRPLARSHAWNFQLGTLAHWLGGALDGRLVFNTRGAEGFTATVLNPRTGARYPVPQAIFTVAHDGVTALSNHFARLQPLRPGYAYPGVPYDVARRPAPADEGIVRVDLRTGATRLLVSYAEMAARFRIPPMGNAPLVFSRVLFNADDSRFVFSLRFCEEGTQRWWTSLITADRDGGSLVQVVDFYRQVAHFDWADRTHLLAWCAPDPHTPAGFHLITDGAGETAPLNAPDFTADGHCCYDPSGRYVLTDTFPDAAGRQHLRVFDTVTRRTRHLGSFPADPRYRGDLRCDLHPCWSRDGGAALFDALENGRRVIRMVTLR